MLYTLPEPCWEGPSHSTNHSSRERQDDFSSSPELGAGLHMQLARDIRLAAAICPAVVGLTDCKSEQHCWSAWTCFVDSGPG
jgi:hypothetical protein